MKTVNAIYAGYVTTVFKDGKWTVTVSSSTHVTKYILDTVSVAACSFVAAGDPIGGVKINQPVDNNCMYAMKPGTVKVIQTGDTWQVIVTHADGSNTVYSNLTRVFVTNCSRVNVGDLIGCIVEINVPDVSLTGIMSVSGGGDLTEDRFFSLVNDEEDPEPNYHYGTDDEGVRGWYPTPPNNPLQTYLVNNGLSVDPTLSNRFQLGGPLIHNTTITGNEKYLAITDGRFLIDKGINVAAANNLTLGNDGNTFTITGNTQINAITTLNWQAGTPVYLIFAGSPRIKNNTTGGAGTAPIALSGNEDFDAVVGDTITLVYDGAFWRESTRSLIVSGGGRVTNASNLGGGLDNYSSKQGNTLRFNTFSAIDFSLTANLFTINPTLKNYWNGKQDAITLTTTGTSGPATLIANVLNIPQYGGGGGGGGSVMSVDASVTAATALTVTGGPITNTGTLAFSWTGNNTQYVLGDGTLVTIPSPFAVTADNGLYANTTSNVRLGGELIEDTTVWDSGIHTLLFRDTKETWFSIRDNFGFYHDDGADNSHFQYHASHLGHYIYIKNEPKSQYGSLHVNHYEINGISASMERSSMAQLHLAGGDTPVIETALFLNHNSENTFATGLQQMDINTATDDISSTISIKKSDAYYIRFLQGSTGVEFSTKSALLDPYKGIHIDLIGDLMFHNYPDTRDDGDTSKAFYVGVDGKLKYGDIAGGGSGGGTVTSVDASVTAATALTVTGGPITTAGTLAFSWTGNNTQYVAGDGTLGTLPTLGITADNGLTANTSTNVQLGGTLLFDTTIIAGSNYTLNITGSRTGINSTLYVTNTSSGRGVTANSTNGIGVVSSGGVLGGNFSSIDGGGLWATSVNNVAMYASSTNSLVAQFVNQPASTNTVVTIMELLRTSSNAGAIGNGVAVDLFCAASTATIHTLSNRLISKLTSVTSPTSQFEIWGVDSAVSARKLAIAGNGAVTFDTYGAGTHTGTLTKYLGTTATGNIIEVDAPIGGGGGDGNNYPTTLDFNTSDGVLTLGRNGLSSLSTSFDGRYLMSITADNGVTANTTSNVQLGSLSNSGVPFTATRFINTGINTLRVRGSSTSQTLQAENTGSGYALNAEASTGIAARLFTAPASIDTSVPILDISRSTTGGTAANGIGAQIDWYIQTTDAINNYSGSIKNIWTNATAATRTSQFEWWGVNNGGVGFKKADLNSATGHTVYSTQSVPFTSDELNTTPDAWTITGSFTSTGGGRYDIPNNQSGSISFNFGTLVIGDVYILSYSKTSINGSSDQPTFGGQTGTSTTSGSEYRHMQFKVTSTSGLLTIAVSAAASGTPYINQISLRKVNNNTPFAYAHNTQNGTNGFEVRSDYVTQNMGIGYQAARFLTNQTSSVVFGMRNIAIGSNSQELNTVGADNISVGYRALQLATETDECIAIGANTLRTTLTSYQNVAVSANSMQYLTTGNRNTALGNRVLNSITTGNENTAIGSFVLDDLLTGSGNTGIGHTIFPKVTGGTNTGIGYVVGQALTTGSGNIGMGYFSLNLATTGNHNIAIGTSALNIITTGAQNISIGAYSASSSLFSTALEVTQFRGNIADNHNIFIGAYAWKNTGTNVITSRSIAIGYDARVYQSDQVVLGGNDVSSTFLKGDIELRNFNVLALNNLSDHTFPSGTTKWAVTGAVTLGTDKATFDLNSGSTGTLTQTLANLAIAGKSERWYKVTMTSSNTPLNSLYSSFLVTISGSTFATQNLEFRQTNSKGTSTVKIYFKSKVAPTDIQFTFTGTLGSGNGILDVTNIEVKECLGGDLFLNRNLEVYGGAIRLTQDYTPTGTTDNTYPSGTITTDDNYLYRRNSLGNWTKIAWSPL